MRAARLFAFVALFSLPAWGDEPASLDRNAERERAARTGSGCSTCGRTCAGRYRVKVNEAIAGKGRVALLSVVVTDPRLKLRTDAN